MHVCEVCYLPSLDHESDDYWPAPCCEGCPCGSYEAAYGEEEG